MPSDIAEQKEYVSKDAVFDLALSSASAEDRWLICQYLLPGFSALPTETARAMFQNIRDVKYMEPRQNHQDPVLDQTGFIEVRFANTAGVLLLSTELKKIFIHAQPQERAYLTTIANDLATGSGWPTTNIENLTPTAKDAAPPYLHLAQKYGKEILAALDEFLSSPSAHERRWYFVRNLEILYGHLNDRNFQKFAKAKADKDTLREGWLEECGFGIVCVTSCLYTLRTSGVDCVFTALGNEASYEPISQSLDVLPAVQKLAKVDVWNRQVPTKDPRLQYFRDHFPEEKEKKRLLADERWWSYYDILPGFANLDKATSDTVYRNLANTRYHSLAPDNKQAANSFGVIETSMADGSGVLAFSPLLKKVFVFSRSSKTVPRLIAMARVLSEAAGWPVREDSILLQNHLNSSGKPDYSQLATEVQSKIFDAHIEAYDSAQGNSDRIYPVQELIAFYAANAERHTILAALFKRENDERASVWQRQAKQEALHIVNQLETLHNNGYDKVYAATVRDIDYRSVAVRLQQQYNSVLVTNIPPRQYEATEDVAIRHGARLSGEAVLGEYNKAKAEIVSALRREQAENPDTASDQLLRLVKARKQLSVLHSSNVPTIGYKENTSLQDLVANIGKLSARISQDGLFSSQPPALRWEQTIEALSTEAQPATSSASTTIALGEIRTLTAEQNAPVIAHEDPASPKTKDTSTAPQQAAEPPPVTTIPVRKEDISAPIAQAIANAVGVDLKDAPPAEKTAAHEQVAAILPPSPTAAPVAAKPAVDPKPVATTTTKIEVAPSITPTPPTAGPAPQINTAGTSYQPTAPAAVPPRRPTAPPTAQVSSRSILKKSWGLAKTIFARAKKQAPALIVGAATGSAVRIACQYAIASLVLTNPGTIAITTAAIVSGAVAGGAARLAITALFDRTAKTEKNWRRRAFAKGALMGAVGGAAGSLLTQWVMAHYYPHAFEASTGAQQPTNLIDPDHLAPKDPPPPPPPPSPQTPTEVQHPTGAEAGPQDLKPTPPATPAPHMGLPTNAPLGLSTDLFDTLPKNVQRLAASHNPKTLALFYKEASYHLMHGKGHTKSTVAAGVALIEKGLHVAKQANFSNSVVRMLHADYAYAKAWGIGTVKDVPLALKEAELSKAAIHNYGGRLIKLLRPSTLQLG